MPLPDAYIIGAPKAGTTSLSQWLAQHPDVFFSVPKEPFYWASDFPRLRRHYGFDSLDAYRRLFDSAAAARAQVRAEGSTFYLYSETAVPAIVAAVERPRFVVAVRDPVDLIISYHRAQVVALNESATNFATAWRRSVEGRGPAATPLDPKQVDYPRVARLGEALARLLRTVPATDVHTVCFDDLVSDPAGVYAAMLAFLGLPDRHLATFQPHNVSDKMYRSPVLRRLTHRPPALLAAPVRRFRQFSRTTDSALVRRAKRAMWRSEPRPSVPTDVRLEVAEYLRDDIALLGELLRTDLSHWGRATGRP